MRWHWKSIVGVVLAAWGLWQPAWRLLRPTLEMLGNIALVLEHTAVIAAVVAFFLQPPPWTIFPALLGAGMLIWWDLRRRAAQPIKRDTQGAGDTADVRPIIMPPAIQPPAPDIAEHPAIEGLRHETSILSARLTEVDRSLYLFASMALDAMENVTLGNMLISCPYLTELPPAEPETSQTMANHYKDMSDFCQSSRLDMRNTSWYNDFELAVKQAESIGENELNRSGKTPESLDPLAFRRYYILRTQTQSIGRFLREAKEVSDRDLLKYRSAMRVRKDVHTLG
jgi:hypothetical protein